MLLIMKKLSAANLLSLAAMSTALGVMALYASSVLPSMKATCLFVAGLVVWIPLNEGCGLVYALLTYAATALIAFLISASKIIVGLYLFYFGCYGIIKFYMERKVHDKILSMIFKLIISNILIAASVFIAGRLFEIDVITMLPYFPEWLIICALEIFFILYDLVYGFFARFFDNNLRIHIIKRR